MPDIPSSLLKGLGILLLFIGLFGTISGFYAMWVVYNYDFGSLETGDMKSSISKTTEVLERYQGGIETSITDTSKSLKDASAGMGRTGEEVDSAAKTIEGVSGDMGDAADNLRVASSSQKDAATYLNSAASKYRSWASTATFNGSPFPDKSTFDSASKKLETAADKLEDSGKKLELAAEKLDDSAVKLGETSERLTSASQEMGGVGESLNRSAASNEGLKAPLSGVVVEFSNPLKESVKSLETISDVSSNIKTLAYGMVGYLILLHIIILGIGIALIIIETNLFYPM
jgi:methyl-accepting chemotaxis protein